MNLYNFSPLLCSSSSSSVWVDFESRAKARERVSHLFTSGVIIYPVSHGEAPSGYPFNCDITVKKKKSNSDTDKRQINKQDLSSSWSKA